MGRRPIPLFSLLRWVRRSRLMVHEPPTSFSSTPTGLPLRVALLRHPPHRRKARTAARLQAQAFGHAPTPLAWPPPTLPRPSRDAGFYFESRLSLHSPRRRRFSPATSRPLYLSSATPSLFSPFRLILPRSPSPLPAPIRCAPAIALQTAARLPLLFSRSRPPCPHSPPRGPPELRSSHR